MISTPTIRAGSEAASLSDTHRIQHAIEHATHLLPSQGPIKVFVHHNTLHAFEEQKFEQGVISGLEIYGCEPYFSEERYRAELERGRIKMADVASVLQADLAAAAGTYVTPLATRYQIRLAMLRSNIEYPPEAELQWLLAETDVLKRFRRETSREAREAILTLTKQLAFARQRIGGGAAEGEQPAEVWSESKWEAHALQQLWNACLRGCQRVPTSTSTAALDVADEPGLRHRDLLLDAVGQDSDQLVHEVLIRFCATYLDQGFASWELPDRDEGLLNAFVKLFMGSWSPTRDWMQGLPAELRRVKAQQPSAMQVVAESLRSLGVPPDEWDAYILRSLLALRGWAGMIWQMESNAPWTPRPAQAGSLVDFLAIRLLLDRFAVAHIARRELKIEKLSEVGLVAKRVACQRLAKPRHGDAYVAFQVAQSLGWSVDQLETLTVEDWKQFVFELRDFDELQRRRILHLAYEARYRNSALDAIAIHSADRREIDQATAEAPLFQVVTCIDDREESFRRHLEEVAPACETFGAVGFFAVVMYYRGAAEAHYRPLCPINAIPKHYVCEEPLFSATGENARRSVRRRVLGQLSHQFHTYSRTMLGGLVTGVLGSLATIPLVTRVLAPHVTARIRSRLGSMVRPPSTELHLEREAADPGSDYESLGFSIAEMAGIVIRILNDIGLVDNFSKIVLFLGHGSSSLNNPHESAYNCGACSGGRGGPNARSFARMANDHRVRSLVAAAGVDIPPDTHFVGGYHNTCNDKVDYYDLDLVPRSHRPLFREMEQKIDQARGRNAVERSRRFELAGFGLTPDEALQHVEERAEDLSQARPEYNHATNALCLVGQREWSRGLFLDRRAFLASYDPQIDDEQGTIVERILQAAIPVCGGISLEYYFSTVDPEGYGCGSKLPHNIVSLAGVMTGAASDLRPGLSAQMVEIHEPLRILFVVQTTPACMRRIIDSNPPIKLLVEGDWVQLALLDANTSEILLYRNGQFLPHTLNTSKLPKVSQSVNWFEGRGDHLGFATILEPTTPTPQNKTQSTVGELS